MEIYLSYEESDREYGNRLKQGLFPPAQELGYSVWSMQDIIPGYKWQEEMAEHLRDARLFVPLVSADFLASNRCHAEMMGAIHLASRGSLKLVPVILRPCMWEYSVLSDLPTLPTNGREVTAWGNQDKAWVHVQGGILKVVRSFLVA